MSRASILTWLQLVRFCLLEIRKTTTTYQKPGLIPVNYHRLNCYSQFRNLIWPDFLESFPKYWKIWCFIKQSVLLEVPTLNKAWCWLRQELIVIEVLLEPMNNTEYMGEWEQVNQSQCEQMRETTRNNLSWCVIQFDCRGVSKTSIFTISTVLNIAAHWILILHALTLNSLLIIVSQWTVPCFDQITVRFLSSHLLDFSSNLWISKMVLSGYWELHLVSKLVIS